MQDPSDEMLEEVGAPQVKRVKFQDGGQYTGEQQRYSRIAPFTPEEQAAAEMDEDDMLQDGEALEPSSPRDEPLSPSDRCCHPAHMNHSPLPPRTHARTHARMRARTFLCLLLQSCNFYPFQVDLRPSR